MDKKKMIHYIDYVLDAYDFVIVTDDPYKVIEEEDKKEITDEEKERNIKRRIKKLVKDKIIEEFNKNPKQFDYKYMKKMANDNVDEYTKIAIINTVYGIIYKDKENDPSFNKEYIRSHGAVKRVLNNLFIEEDDDNTVEQELSDKYIHLKEMFKQYKEHYYIKEEKNPNSLTMKEINELITRYRKYGDLEARNTIVEKNIGLCYKYAGWYQAKDNVMLNVEDLVNDGIEGMIKAIDKFNPKKGVRFSTYATWWIKQNITRSSENNFRSIRIPVHKVAWLKKIKRQINNIAKQYGNLEAEELCKKLGISQDEYEEYRTLMQGIGSLNQKVSKEDGESSEEVGSFIPDAEDYAEKAIQNVDREILFGVLDKCLTPREKEIIIKRFGLNGEDETTLENVGKELHVTRERVRQIEAKARRKVREYYRRNKIKTDYN